MCAVTREIRPVSELIRFVVGPDGAVVPDVKSKLPGRGLWITATPRGAGRGRQAQGVRAAASSGRCGSPPDLADQTERLLERAALDALAMAGKAGAVAAGFAKTEAALEHEGGHRAASCRATRPPTGCASSMAGSAAPAVGRNRRRDRIFDRRRNWIWH